MEESLTDAIEKITVLSQTISPVTAAIGLGDTVRYAGHDWIVVHITQSVITLGLMVMSVTLSAFDTINNSTVYKGSTLANTAKSFENTLPASALSAAIDTTVSGVTAKIFVPSKTQFESDFEYFKTQTNRRCLNAAGGYPDYWTSSAFSNDYIYYVDGSSGGITFSNVRQNGTPSTRLSFRPFIRVAR